MATKICSKCNQKKNIKEFYKSSHYRLKDGLDYYCKYCRNGASIKNIKSTTKKPCSVTNCYKPHYAKSYCRTHYMRVYTNGTVERLNEVRDLNIPIHHYRRDIQLQNTYNIDINEYLKRAAKGCELCGEMSLLALHVDHDHKCCPGDKSCGVCVRGIICHSCNSGVDKYEKGILRGDYPKYKMIEKYVKSYNG